MSDYYDRNGNEITEDEWLRRCRDHAYKRVAYHEVGTLRVSTIWLGLDYGWGDRPPLIFETMIFGEPGEDQWRHDQWRYATEEEAMKGHQRAVRLCRRRKAGRS
jgi:hypothetical protein